MSLFSRGVPKRVSRNASKNTAKDASNNKRGRPRQRKKEPAASRGPARGAQRQQAASLDFGYLIGLQKQMGREAFSRLLKSPLATVLNSLMIAVAFALPALLYLMVLNLQVLGGSWDGQPRISVYLNQGLNQQRINAVVNVAEQDENLVDVVYISPDQGLKDFREKSGVGDITSELGFNPLPGVLVLTPALETTVTQLENIVTDYQKLSGVNQVQVDREWVQRLNAILELLERAVMTLGVLLGVTALLVIINTLRLNIESRRDEIRIVKMVGGTDGFITLPFIYMGAWYGIAGAILAQIITLLVMSAVSDQVMSLAGLYNSGLNMETAGFSMFGALLATGVLLGITGAKLSCHRHLRTLAPE